MDNITKSAEELTLTKHLAACKPLHVGTRVSTPGHRPQKSAK